jgi:hypothetical protein
MIETSLHVTRGPPSGLASDQTCTTTSLLYKSQRTASEWVIDARHKLADCISCQQGILRKLTKTTGFVSAPEAAAW